MTECIACECEFFNRGWCMISGHDAFIDEYGFSPCYVGGAMLGYDGVTFDRLYGEEYADLFLADVKRMYEKEDI